MAIPARTAPMTTRTAIARSSHLTVCLITSNVFSRYDLYSVRILCTLYQHIRELVKSNVAAIETGIQEDLFDLGGDRPAGYSKRLEPGPHRCGGNSSGGPGWPVGGIDPQNRRAA